MSEPNATEPAPTILVVETDILVRHVIADYLRGCGYRVLEAATGEEATLILDVEAEGIVLDQQHGACGCDCTWRETLS